MSYGVIFTALSWILLQFKRFKHNLCDETLHKLGTLCFSKLVFRAIPRLLCVCWVIFCRVANYVHQQDRIPVHLTWMHVRVNMISFEPCVDYMVVKAKLESQCAIRHKSNDMKHCTFDNFVTILTQKDRSSDPHNPSSVEYYVDILGGHKRKLVSSRKWWAEESMYSTTNPAVSGKYHHIMSVMCQIDQKMSHWLGQRWQSHNGAGP